MSEIAKTLTYVGVAVAALLVAWVTVPRPPKFDESSQIGSLLAAVKDPLDAAQLSIVKYDEDQGVFQEFEVKQTDKGWAIPSHQDYPADAAEQMGQAATSVMNLKILDVVSREPGNHKIYGVVAPDPKKLKTGAEGVGMSVQIEDKKGKPMADLIIGKEVEGAEGQRYVREANRDAVYLVSLDPSSLSTNFGDWIEKDLLKINPFDIQSIELNDYSVQEGFDQTGRPVRYLAARTEMELDYDQNAEKSWKLKALREFDGKQQKFVDAKIAEDEVVDQVKLNDLKSALDDLKIVDVERKPEGLSADLKADKSFLTNLEALQSLQARGYYVPQKTDGTLEIKSSEGEVLCKMNDGVEYVLRFGDTKQPSANTLSSGENQGSGLNRYLFVVARVNEDGIPQPKLTPLPKANKAEEPDSKGSPDDAKKVEPKDTAESQDTEAGQPEQEPGSDQQDTQKEKEEAAKDSGEGGDAVDDSAEANLTVDEADTEQATESKEEPAAANKKSTEQPTEESAKESAEDASAEKSVKPDETAAEAKDADEPKEKATADPDQALRKKIEKDNKREMDAYQERVADAQRRVKELNERFGDWYFIISDDVYKKVHLSRSDILKKEEKKEEDAAEGDKPKPSGAINNLLPKELRQ